MSERTEGLKKKYHVERVDGKPLKGNGCVVMEFGDPNAWAALKVWAKNIRKDGYHWLANDIERVVAQEELKSRLEYDGQNGRGIDG